MRKIDLFAASAIALVAAMPAHAQTATATPGTGQETPSSDTGYGTDIVVTAQRQAQTLQEVPIAVSAFSAEALEKQQIDNASDLQLTLPNVNFSKGNFTGASFTIRGIGDLCVGISCDAATAIHLNGSPLLATRIFETEYFDLERVEVLRGPQGTLFGRSATSGVVNFITAKPRTDKVAAAGEVEYGNYDSIRAKAMFNLPIGDTLAVRVAGFYLNRDGYTRNLYNNTRLDGRDMYSVRGSIRWEPSIDTSVDILASYFKEDDNRLRIQKQLCQYDATGTLGCLNGRRDAARTNSNSTFTGTLGSREFLAINGIPGVFGLGSLYGADAYSGNPILTDPREVFTAYDPTYKTDELTVQGRIEHNFGGVKAQLTGFYHETSVDSSQDYNLGVSNRALVQPALNVLAAAAAGGIPGLPASYFSPIAAALIPNGPTGDVCTSLPEETGLGSYGGFKRCSSVPLAFDRSVQKTRDYSVEGIISSDFDGMFNFLLGGIYVDGKVTNGDYYVNAFAIDYVTGILGTFGALGQRDAAGAPAPRPPSFLGTPFFRNATAEFRLKSYGIFGETYFDLTDKLNVTLGLRYNNDKKYVRSRSTLASFPVPFSQTGSAFDTQFGGNYDADPVNGTCAPLASPAGAIGSRAGCDPFAIRNRTFDEVTGRAVVNYKITEDNLLYASYSRGYKSGGFNPPVQVPGLTVPDSFVPEIINAFEVGSKNTFDNGRFTFNLTGFYYKYKGLQLSRIVARTSINDNIDANIYGLEADAIFRPSRTFAVNMGASYLKTKVTSSQTFINQRDPSGGNPNSVIIKDITNGANCVVNATSAAQAQAYVGAVNTGLGLRAPAAYASDANLGAATGAFSICSVLNLQRANPALAALATGVSVSEGNAISLRGNELPQAPVAKFSIGAQNTFEFANGMSFVPRVDLTYTGESYGNIFNGPINRIQGYEQVNAQIQLNGDQDRWFIRGFIQNAFDNNATTGLYLTDQSSGLFTNIFTLEPRRYGVAAGFKF